MLGEHAAGRTMLNLFAYTGSFTVYAAAGGARRTVTVDMSRTYQAWSRRNLIHNGLNDPTRHSFVQSDVLPFIQRMRAARALFDLIVLDPPSFSNSKRMQTTFDVQRDHPALLRCLLYQETQLSVALAPTSVRIRGLADMLEYIGASDIMVTQTWRFKTPSRLSGTLPITNNPSAAPSRKIGGTGLSG